MFSPQHENDRLLNFFLPLMSDEIYDITFNLIRSLTDKDPSTVYHSNNVANYAMMIACELTCSKEECFKFYLGGLLHDIGKLEIPDAILFKPSTLSAEEYDVIKQHPQRGYDILNRWNVYKEYQILEMTLHHHERFDGAGYPLNLKGNDIPLPARIISIADSFDAMTTRRIYRKENDLEFAVNQISQNIGSQFDPEIANIFLKIIARERSKSSSLQFLTMECMRNGIMECCS